MTADFEAFTDRVEAGRELAGSLAHLGSDVLVLGLPRGGVPVAAQVAESLGAPLDVYVGRKLGVPGHEELAMGAIASGGVRVLDVRRAQTLGVSERDIEEVARRELVELRRREEAYRGNRPIPDARGKTGVVVDDGLATGATMQAAVRGLRERGAGRIVVAVPVASAQACSALAEEADQLVCLHQPEPFMAVGRWYDDFRPTTDEEVRHLLSGRVGEEPANLGRLPGRRRAAQ